MSATAAHPSDIPSPTPDAEQASSAERMAHVRRLVRDEGKTAEEAAQVVGVDPIIAQLWLRLPDELWQGAAARPVAGAPLAGFAASSPAPTAPSAGLRRVITCRVPSPAYDRLRSSDAPLLEAASNALETGLALPLPDQAPGGWRFARRPLAVPVSAATFQSIAQLASAHFKDDSREAAGWLIARGLGMALPLPTADELAGVFQERTAAPVLSPAQAPAPTRFVLPPRRRPEARAPLPPDDSAPSGDELRQRREEVGISQRDLAAASGLSRGLVAEIERGRRRHVLTRLRLAETLASLARSK